MGTRDTDPTHGPTLRPVPETEAGTRPDPWPDPPTTTTAALAAELGTSSGNLRKWCRRRGLLPEPPGPGQAIAFTDDQAAAVRKAWGSGQTRDMARPTTADDPTHGPTHGPTQPETWPDPWRELVAELRADNDRLRSQLDAANVKREEALRRAEEAERGRASAEARQEAVRAAAWRWCALASSRGLWARLRGRMPEPPAELAASDRLLSG